MSQTGLRRENRRRLLRALVENGPTSRSRLADHLGLTQAAISRLVREMICAGVLDEGDKLPTEGRPGRQFINVGFASRKLFVVGLGLEAFSQAIVIADLTGEVVASRSLGITRFSDSRAVLARIADEIAAMAREEGIAAARLVGIGAAVVGTVDRATGRVVRSSHLGWTDVPIADDLEELTGLPVVADNLLHSTNLAEHAFGVSKGRRNVLLVRTSLSVGASLIVDDGVARGAMSRAGQIAHVPIASGSEPCTCGNVGCLETVASGRAILARAEGRSFVDLAGDDIGALSLRLADLLKRAEEGDEDAHLTVLESGRSLGTALEWPLATMDPDCVVLSGPVARHPSYVQGVREGMAPGNRSAGGEDRPLLVSHMPIREVALRLAIGEFLMARDLDMAALEAANEDGDERQTGARADAGLVAG